MDLRAAVLPTAWAEIYVGGSPERLKYLVERGYLVRLCERKRGVCYLRKRIDQALLMAEANGDDFSLKGLEL